MDERNGVVAPAIVAAVLAVAAGIGRAERACAAEAGAKPDVEVTIVAVQYEGTKLWVPATIAVNEGDRVRVSLINKIPTDPAQHGRSIDAFKVAEVVDRGGARRR